ncbi:hypothetical protein H6P81_002224 [Aristolochia fimbriata]|uniref:Uncharacterized protein n=1 Tax=Aristolochia fimbriata TaxID=158543 RepID=A0AAV7FAC5_ARIFI|nr:hypothetical protein H6P81_002224 [Aristolochia fimbriata]
MVVPSSHDIPDTIQGLRHGREVQLEGATLTFLYRELAKVCRTRVVGIVGCLTLIQVECPTDECHKPWWKPGAIQDRVEPLAKLSGDSDGGCRACSMAEPG